MHAIAPSDTTVRYEYTNDHGSFVVTDFLGAMREGGPEPQAFLVDFQPGDGGQIRPHFHDVRQFQVIVEGEGRIGKTPLSPVTFHYADPFTPYGPIVPSTDRLVFFTLRADGDPSGHVMPGSKHLMPKRAGRNVARHLEASDEPSAVVIEPYEDGLASFKLVLGPGEARDGVPGEGGGGQYCLVTKGSLVLEGRELPPRSLLFVYPEEGPPELTAGASGCEILVMQFPVASQRQSS